MTSEGLGEMFEGESADTCAGKFPEARTPIGASGNFLFFSSETSHGVYSHTKKVPQWTCHFQYFIDHHGGGGCG
jgi:hypothetical protein